MPLTMLETIYIVRLGKPRQAKDLQKWLDRQPVKVDVFYSSPSAFCLSTLKPAIDAAVTKKLLQTGVRVEYGFGEWFGPYSPRERDPLDELQNDFDNLDANYQDVGPFQTAPETLEDLHMRVLYTLDPVIRDLDEDPTRPKTVLICTHAPTMIAMSRILTGKVPKSTDKRDFRVPMCGVSKFSRKPDSTEVVGGWEIKLHGYTGFLYDGERELWHFQPGSAQRMSWTIIFHRFLDHFKDNPYGLPADIYVGCLVGFTYTVIVKFLIVMGCFPLRADAEAMNETTVWAMVAISFTLFCFPPLVARN
ncbi:hypothetical protein K469DRAFT_689869 [Zopfia rhizophila CBS 207.26]|uniref:Phosphoglycerate mutase-like protein n=1 Tax=Zopfia rhizophila CBS 207.26 TaxID=1314779 RepID=A0A6A6DXI8_9PEZI|nr:hypothetical protein K469DRAFT_689869 [Zopfia rhizophila CBS 207.26]